MFRNANFKMSPETNLIVLCARTFLSNSELSNLRSALAEPFDWNVLDQTAEDHAVTPLVAYVLSQNAADLIPADRSKSLQDRLLLAARNNLAWVQEWLKVLNELAEDGIPAISFKGPALALMAYRNLALREFTDLDLLVQPHDVLRTRDVLGRNGYVLDSVVPDETDSALTRSSDRQVSFSNEERRTTIDLHWGVVQERSSFRLEVGPLFESALVECHEGISFLSLSPEYLLLVLCVHGTKHCWSNLRCLCDVACHVNSSPNLDWALCIRLAEIAECVLVLKHSLLLAERVLGLELPAPIIRYARSDAKADSLAEMAQTFLFRENDRHSPYLDDRSRYLEVLRYRVAFASGWRWQIGRASCRERV